MSPSPGTEQNYDVITFGSATRDVHVVCDDFLIVHEKKFVSGKGIAVSLGSKINVSDIFFRTGGGGTNAAATFQMQDLKVAWCGMVGGDIGGKEITKELQWRNIGTDFVGTTKKKLTDYSIVLQAPKQDRTILVYHGASSELTAKDVPWQSLQTNCFYIAPLSGKLAHLFSKIVDFAVSKSIKIIANPGNTQLSLPKHRLQKILSKIDVLTVNQEEAAFLASTRFTDGRIVMRKTMDFIGPRKIAIITEGPLGALASDGKFLYHAPALKTKVVDRTGAGDAFGAGFASKFIKDGDVIGAMQFGIANSASCISRCGAKEGLLKGGQLFRKVKVKKTIL